jgi:outer membrane protein assembly factor BamB
MRFLAAALLLTLPAYPEPNWPQWRGPNAAGISESTRLPSKWSASENIAWKTEVPGRGHSQPVVWKDRIFLTTDIEGENIPDFKEIVHMAGKEKFVHPDWTGAELKHTLKVLCYDANTGKQLWEQTAYTGKATDYRHRRNTYASPTPVADGRALYVYFESMGVYAYDFNGKQLWTKSLGPIASMGMGPGTSPVLVDDLVIIQADQDDGKNSFIVALSKKDGKEVWRKPRPVQASWATPLLYNGQLIASGNEKIIAYDPKTGAELWSVPGLDSHAINSPVPGDGMVVISSGFPSKRTFGIKPAAEGDRVMWKYEKGTAYVPSPILYRGLLYLMSDKGLLTCLDPKTGNVIYEGKRIPVPATFMASPVAADGKLFITSQDGDTFVIKAGPEHEVLSTNQLGEPVVSSMALTDDSIYIRAEKHLYRIKQM